MFPARFATAAIVPQREIHNVTASGTVSGTESGQSFPGDTSTPTSPVTATATAPGSVATLDLSFTGLRVDGTVDSSSTIGPILPGLDLPTQTSGSGTFSLTFSVPQPTPYILFGSLTSQGDLIGNRGFSSVTLLEDGTTAIYARDSSFIAFGNSYPLDARGTFQPGHTYTLAASARTGLATSPLGRAQFSQGTTHVTLTVPEPASLALLAPGALALMRRRRR